MYTSILLLSVIRNAWYMYSQTLLNAPTAKFDITHKYMYVKVNRSTLFKRSRDFAPDVAIVTQVKN